jgi:hypothetical protein
MPDRASDRAIDLARDRDLVLAQAVQTASSGDVEHGPVSAPTFLISISPMIGISCSPRLCKLRHRGDVEHGPVSAPTS